MFILPLAGNGRFSGKIVHAAIDTEYPKGSILVLPSAGEEFFVTMVTNARNNGGNLAVIVEKGGPGAHLVVTANEKNSNTNPAKQGIAVFLLPDARKKLPIGSEGCLDTFTNTLEIVDNDSLKQEM